MTDDEALAYRRLLRTLEDELAVVTEAFDRLTEADWARPTRLRPPADDQPPWTLLELAGHLDVSVGLTGDLIADPRLGPAERDAVSFFIFPTAEVAEDFYDYARESTAGTTPAKMAEALRESFSTALLAARSTPPYLIGAFPGFEPNPLIRLDDWVSSRIVEAVVHGLDLTDALGSPTTATAAGIQHTALLFDDLLARTADPGRPVDLADDLLWVRAAAGRDRHRDPRLPLIG